MRAQVVVQWRGPEAHSEAGKEADVGRRRQVREAPEAVERRGGMELLDHSISPAQTRNEYPPQSHGDLDFIMSPLHKDNNNNDNNN